MGKRVSVEHARVPTAGFVKNYGTAYDSDDDVILYFHETVPLTREVQTSKANISRNLR